MATQVLEGRASFSVSDSSSQSCAFSLMVSGMRLTVAFSIPNAVAIQCMKRGWPYNECTFSTKIHRHSSAFITCFVQAHRILDVASVSCLRQQAFDIRFRESHRWVLLLFPRCVLDMNQNDRPSSVVWCLFHSHGTRENVRTARVERPRWPSETWEC